MSEHIPQNIDEMLWRTAESADANLRSEFLSSHPSYAQELAAREGVVDAMRAARPVAPEGLLKEYATIVEQTRALYAGDAHG